MNPLTPTPNARAAADIVAAARARAAIPARTHGVILTTLATTLARTRAVIPDLTRLAAPGLTPAAVPGWTRGVIPGRKRPVDPGPICVAARIRGPAAARGGTWARVAAAASTRAAVPG